MTHPPASTLASNFRHCPRCATPDPVITGGREINCPACGWRFFFNTAAAAGAFILHRQQVLLCVRAHDPGQGLLDVPGGFIEFDESIEAGLAREIAEELNIAVAEFRYLISAPNDYPYAGVPYKTADMFFVAEAESLATLRSADDVAEIRLLRPSAVPLDEFAFASTRRAFQALLAHLESAG